MCSAFTPDCGYDNSSTIFIENMYCPKIQSVRVNFAGTKRLLNLSAEAIINVRNARLCASCGKFLLKVKQVPFSCRLVKGFKFLKRAQNQFKMLLEMSFVQVRIVQTGTNANLLAVV